MFLFRKIKSNKIHFSREHIQAIASRSLGKKKTLHISSRTTLFFNIGETEEINREKTREIKRKN